jgi:uncharacterized membrane protein YhhN
MGLRKTRLYMAGLIAFLLGMPLTTKVFARSGDIWTSAWDLGWSIADSSDGS